MIARTPVGEDPAARDPSASGQVWRRVVAVTELPAVVEAVTYEECLLVGPGSVVLDPDAHLEGIVGFALDREFREPSSQVSRAVLAHPDLSLLEGANVVFRRCRFLGCGFSRLLIFVDRSRLQHVIGGLADGRTASSLRDPRLPRMAGNSMAGNAREPSAIAAANQ